MNKLKSSKIVFVLSVLLVLVMIGSVSAADEAGNETVSTSNSDVDTIFQEVDSVDDEVSAADNSDEFVGSDTTNESLVSNELENNNLLSVDDDNEILEDDYTPHTFTELFTELKGVSGK